MMTHSDVWRAIDLLAAQNGLSISELARQAGLDRTACAKSKRRRYGRPRWPSTENLSRIPQATDPNMSQFSALLHSHAGQGAGLRIPIIGLAQAGRLVVLGDVGDDLGDSLYEADIYVGGTVASLGADCEEKEMTSDCRRELEKLLAEAGVTADVTKFRRYGSAKKLYHFNIDNAGDY